MEDEASDVHMGTAAGCEATGGACVFNGMLAKIPSSAVAWSMVIVLVR